MASIDNQPPEQIKHDLPKVSTPNLPANKKAAGQNDAAAASTADQYIHTAKAMYDDTYGGNWYKSGDTSYPKKGR